MCGLLLDAQALTVSFLQIATIPGPDWIHVWGRLSDGTGTLGAYDYWIPAVPDPGTVSLLGVGGLALMRRRRENTGNGASVRAEPSGGLGIVSVCSHRGCQLRSPRARTSPGCPANCCSGDWKNAILRR
jgi:MYXO-CTERM domain-containing protein